MTQKEAYRIYKAFKRHVNKNCDNPDTIFGYPELHIVESWHDADNIPSRNNLLDKVVDDAIGGGNNTVSDEITTVEIKGVLMNVWRHYCLCMLACPFLYRNKEENYVLDYEQRPNNTIETIKTYTNKQIESL
jgi:hypothetical protein